MRLYMLCFYFSNTFFNAVGTCETSVSEVMYSQKQSLRHVPWRFTCVNVTPALYADVAPPLLKLWSEYFDLLIFRKSRMLCKASFRKPDVRGWFDFGVTNRGEFLLFLVLFFLSMRFKDFSGQCFVFSSGTGKMWILSIKITVY